MEGEHALEIQYLWGGPSPLGTGGGPMGSGLQIQINSIQQ